MNIIVSALRNLSVWWQRQKHKQLTVIQCGWCRNVRMYRELQEHQGRGHELSVDREKLSRRWHETEFHGLRRSSPGVTYMCGVGGQ